MAETRGLDPEKWLTSWRQAGAFSVSRHDLAKEGLLVSAFLPAGAIVKCAQELKDARYSLLDLSTLQAQEGFVVTYHFDGLDGPGRVAFRTLVPFKKPILPSLYDVFQGAEWHERESTDFFGLTFEGNPNLIPLLLPDDLPGPPPLRKNPADLVPLAKLGLLGQAEILCPDFGDLIGLAAKEGGAAL
ncbi:MAG: NADH-quinone oxidoreductase subunit C [Deltaproteobacteria bacterium]|jgi:NADH-quinone oxidoreductase subunit C|nr:NADH-quinone oxidoreductase subunit C [Deltaproteobacteria bacterium]